MTVVKYLSGFLSKRLLQTYLPKLFEMTRDDVGMSRDVMSNFNSSRLSRREFYQRVLAYEVALTDIGE